MALVFGVESSCDETAVALVENGVVRSNVVASQEVHARFGGVVPELAARDHLRAVVPIAEEALRQANKALDDVEAFAATSAPGLITCLMVGSQFAKSLAMAMNKPFYAVHHLRAHIVSPCISSPHLEPPYLCLLVSGGHTQIVHCVSWMDITLLGGTLDDAAGEAFDKSARLLGFSYAGGMHIEREAQHGDPHRFAFPKPRMRGYDYSFSGLKTAIRYLIEKETAKDAHFVEKMKPHLAASIQFAIVETLLVPLFDAAKTYGVSKIAIAGGVSANTYFRQRLTEECQKRNLAFFFPEKIYCTDNAAMIAFLAEKYIAHGKPPDALSVACRARDSQYDL